MAHLTLYDFRDIDLMMKLAAEANEDGLISTEELADAIGFGEDVRPVGSRAGWMRRYGFLARDKNGLWRLSPSGERIVEARLQASAEKQLEAIPDESMVDVMAHVTKRYWHGDRVTAALLRREFLFGTQPDSPYRGRRRRR